MITVKKEGVILKETKLEFENDGVLNPAILQDGNTVHIFYRAVRRGNYSTIGYAKLEGPLNVIDRKQEPLIIPSTEDEVHGIEDPRIVEIENTYYMTYTAYDGVNALGCYATSIDLIKFEKHGIMVPQLNYHEFNRLTQCNGHLNDKYNRFNVHDDDKNERDRKTFLSDKNVVFFPRLINGKFTFLHRIRPDIQIASVANLKDLNKDFWTQYLLHFKEHILMTSVYDHEISYIGGGCPPIETEAGWLLIYHGVHDSAQGYVYAACAALLDLDDPTKEIARLPYPLFKPDLKWELSGYVSNVVFPTGTSLFDGRLYIYYGAADKRIAVASVDFEELITELLQYKI
ncbi:pesticidal protein Cry7Aa [Flavobacterium sp. PL002]|uniref:glycoside hydrolase family 130 protein n=1 Tax=Flavobacterium sp. PL002 TaxID=1897058 RepID=UPI001787A99E|nr:pesticidal protein Cry7Aa [Flavobacterium sp. PL002]MBE0391884.1 Beta-1,4-mannooligosaccharide phosphorylase [Flavobacterium sp. PL002]